MWMPTTYAPDLQPTVWRYPFDQDTQRRLVSTANPQGDLSNSDLELAACITGVAMLAHHTQTPHHLHVSVATDNTPAAAWLIKGSTSSTTAPAFLLRHLAQQ